MPVDGYFFNVASLAIHFLYVFLRLKVIINQKNRTAIMLDKHRPISGNTNCVTVFTLYSLQIVKSIYTNKQLSMKI